MRRLVAAGLFLSVVLVACGGGKSADERLAQPTGTSPAPGDCAYVIRADGEERSAQFPDGYPAAYWDRQTSLSITVVRPDRTTFEVDVPECLLEEGRRILEDRKRCNEAEEQQGIPFSDRTCFGLGP
ncbi:MAG: hypothetical protein Q8P22_12720 [Chloroflexota bacterium]|nr:hypothetical protein [Chloroflexota bacterium]